MAKIQTVTKGDIIVERVAGRNRMIPVRKVEHNVCSKASVHINGDACYDWGTEVRLSEGEGTLGDLEKEVAGLEEDFPTDEDLQKAGRDSIEAWADRLVRV